MLLLTIDHRLWANIISGIAKTAIFLVDLSVGGKLTFWYTNYGNQWDAQEPHAPISEYIVEYTQNTYEDQIEGASAHQGQEEGHGWTIMGIR